MWTPLVQFILPDDVLTDGEPNKNKFSPMYSHPRYAKALEPTNSVHLVVAGLMLRAYRKLANMAP